MDRLLQSVNMVKGVLQTNLKLRQQNLDLNQNVDQLNADLFHIQCENEELKEKLRIIANVDGEEQFNSNNSNNVNGIQEGIEENDIQNNNKIVPANVGIKNKGGSAKNCGSPHNRMTFASEMFQLKKDKCLLEQRLKDLERENIHIRANNTSVIGDLRRSDVSGTDDFEPVRSVLNGDVMNQGEAAKRRTTNGKYFRYKSRPSGRETSVNAVSKPPKSSYAKIRNLPCNASNYQLIIKFHY